MHWVKIGNMYMDLETFNTFRVASDGMVYMDNAVTWSGDPDESHYMRKESPGVASFLAYLDRCCGAAKFDAESDAELEPETAEKIYKVGDVIQFDTGHDIRTDTIEKVHTPDQSYEVQSYGFLVLQSDIIGLAPPESADHE